MSRPIDYYHPQVRCNFITESGKQCVHRKADSITGFCKTHKGGTRCSHIEIDSEFRVVSCDKASMQNSSKCRRHSQIALCKYFDNETPCCMKHCCSPSIYCLEHGGGRPCSAVDPETKTPCLNRTHNGKCYKNRHRFMPN